MRPWAAAPRSCSAVRSRSSSEARTSGSAIGTASVTVWKAPGLPGKRRCWRMKLEQSFEVKAPIDQVWNVLIDLERVAPCLPGAAITERDEQGTYHGTFQVKLGPTTAAYRGTIKIENADESSHTATLKARGSDKRGQGGASATIVNRLSEEGGGTRVTAETDFTITGRLARFGRGGMRGGISERLPRDSP